MLLHPFPRSYGYQSNLEQSGRPSTATRQGTTVTGGVSHTLGDFTEIIASTDFDVRRVRIIPNSTVVSNTDTAMLLNLYVGAAAAEQPWIMGMLAGWAAHWTIGQNSNRKIYDFPLYLPAGTRISAKAQGQIASNIVTVAIELFGGGDGQWAGSGVESLGVLTASSTGTAVTPGTTSEGAFTDIGATTKRIKYILPQVQGNADTSLVAQSQLMDIGASGALIPGLEGFWQYNYTFEYNTIISTGRYCDIASGVTLQLRGQSSSNDAEAKQYCLYGVY